MGCNKCSTEQSSALTCACKGTNPCQEGCGCKYEVESLSCIRHNGNDMPCLDVVEGDTLEAIIQKVEEKVCEMSSPMDGIDGVSVDHSSFTSTNGTNPLAGISGQTDTYTIWADVEESISFGTYLVYNGMDANNYDSGWIGLDTYNEGDGFGLATYTAGWTNPKIRVIDKTVFLEGYVLIPLAGSTSDELLDNATLYQTTYSPRVQIYTGEFGGFLETSGGTLSSRSPILPEALRPSLKHVVSSFEMSYRNITDDLAQGTITLSTIYPTTCINTDGTLELTTLANIENEGLALAYVNSPYNILVTRATSGESSPFYGNYMTEFTAGVDQRVSLGALEYPVDFDGNIPSNLGGFRVKLTTSYPLGENVTQTAIEEAITMILN